MIHDRPLKCWLVHWCESSRKYWTTDQHIGDRNDSTNCIHTFVNLQKHKCLGFPKSKANRCSPYCWYDVSNRCLRREDWSDVLFERDNSFCVCSSLEKKQTTHIQKACTSPTSAFNFYCIMVAWALLSTAVWHTEGLLFWRWSSRQGQPCVTNVPSTEKQNTAVQ